eukprot:scaffold1850_cov194-Pinguiococcus_pyrenoidosus.AAC.46
MRTRILQRIRSPLAAFSANNTAHLQITKSAARDAPKCGASGRASPARLSEASAARGRASQGATRPPSFTSW